MNSGGNYWPAYRGEVEIVVLEITGVLLYSEDNNESRVGCAVFVPKRDFILMFRLNKLTSSYMAEVIAIDKVVDKYISDRWPEINICSDSLSFLQTLYYASISLFPAALGKLKKKYKTVADLIYKINRINSVNPRIRFTWCLAHIGIDYNEKVDLLAKEAALVGTPFNNYITIKELLSSFQKEYADIDKKFIFEVKETSVGKYYMNNFSDIKFKFIRRIISKKKDYKSLNRLVTGYSYTRLFLF